jgi:hypothetical protein
MAIGDKEYFRLDLFAEDQSKRLYYESELPCVPTVPVKYDTPFTFLWEADDDFGHYPKEGLGARQVMLGGGDVYPSQIVPIPANAIALARTKAFVKSGDA